MKSVTYLIKLKKKFIILLIIIISYTFINSTHVLKPKPFFSITPPKNGYVPNEKTAIRVAEAIWLPLFRENIYRFKPYKAILKNDSIWVVEGTLHDKKGGVPYIEIQKSDCKILKVTHGK